MIYIPIVAWFGENKSLIVWGTFMSANTRDLTARVNAVMIKIFIIVSYGGSMYTKKF